MGTKRLLLLLALVAVCGYAAMQYMSTLGGDSYKPVAMPTTEEMSSTTDEANEVKETAGTGVVKDTTISSGTSAPAEGSANNGGAAAGTIDADLEAIAAAADASYDDSDLNSTFTSEGANSLVDGYDF